MLLAHVAVHALESSYPCIELVVRKDNPARRLYKRSGFKRVDEGVIYVAGVETLTVLAGASASRHC